MCSQLSAATPKANPSPEGTVASGPSQPALSSFADALPIPGPTLEAADALGHILSYSQCLVPPELLLQHFPSLGHVLAAEPSQLLPLGLSHHDLTLLRLVREVASHLARGAIEDRPIISHWQALLTYLQVTMAHEQIEQFRVLFLDRKNRLIADEVQQRGTVHHTPVYPREVVKRALILNASSLIAVHNHPSGDPRPSREDIEMTRRLRVAAEAVEIALHDHIVIGHSTHTSFRTLGLL